ncbi:MAG: PAS domain-containing protein [Methylomonas sp.]
MPQVHFRATEVLGLFSLAVIYALFGKIVIDFFSENHVVSIVWPSSGVALGAVLLGGAKFWPGVCIGAFAANMLASDNFYLSCSLAIGNTLEALIAFRLLSGRSFELSLPYDYYRLLRAGALAVFANSFFASIMMLLSGASTKATFLANWLNWWLGDELGIALVTPLILVWRRLPRGWWDNYRFPETIGFFGFAFLIGQTVFLGWFQEELGQYAKAFFMFALVVWAALRFGSHGTLLIITGTAMQALFGAVLHHGYFARDIVESGLMNLWLYLIVLSVVGVTLALTLEEHRRMADSLLESDARLNEAQHIAHIGCWSLDLRTNALRWSKEIFRIFELDPNQFKESYQSFLEAVHPDDREKVNLAYTQSLINRTPYNIVHRLLMPDGRIKYVEERCLTRYDANNQAFLSVGTVQDVTANIFLENQLRKFQLAVEQTPDSIMITDTDGVIEYVNETCLDITGYAREDFLGKTPSILKSGQTPRETYEKLWDSLRKGNAWKGEFINRRKNGEYYTEQAYIAPIRQSDGMISHYLAIRVDVSEQRRTEFELNQYRNHLEELVAKRTAELEIAKQVAESAMNARSVFLANMSHEIRTPLNAILGLAETGMNASQGRKSHGAFRHILDSGRLLLCVVNDILDFSKIEADKLIIENRPFVLDGMLERVLMITAPNAYRKGLAFAVDSSLNLPKTIIGDELRLSQILINLIANATKFTIQGGLSLSIDMILSNENRCSELLFHVKDSGIGISEDQISKLFRPFEQADGSTARRFGGSGLGLVISQRLANLMKGEIVVKSKVNEGSLFSLRLPLPECVDLSALPRCGEHFCLTGFPEHETLPVITALRKAGAEVSVRLPGDFGFPAQGGILVLPLEAIKKPEAQSSLIKGIGKCKLILATIAGQEVIIPDELKAHVVFINRPLSASRIIEAASTVPDNEFEPLSITKRLQSLRILAVEDNEINQLVLNEILSVQEGAIVTLAADGVKAVELLQTRGYSAFDVVLTDLQMPNMNGFQLAEQISKKMPGFPVIALTANSMSDERDRCLAVGMMDYLSKPIDIEHLVNILNPYIRSRNDKLEPLSHA